MLGFIGSKGVGEFLVGLCRGGIGVLGGWNLFYD